MGRQTPAYVEVARLPGDAAAAVYVEIAFADEAFEFGGQSFSAGLLSRAELTSGLELRTSADAHPMSSLGSYNGSSAGSDGPGPSLRQRRCRTI